MIVSYNDSIKTFTLTPQEAAISGNIKGAYKINCCSGAEFELASPYKYKATIYNNYTAGVLQLNSVSINGSTYTCINQANCSDINPWLVSQYGTGASMTFNPTATTTELLFTGIPGSAALSVNASKGCNVLPIVEALPNAYTLTGTFTDGIYLFSLEKQVNDVLYKEETLYFKTTSIDDILPEHVANNPNSKAHLIYQTIKNGLGCTCNYEDLCFLYKALAIELNIIDKCKSC